MRKGTSVRSAIVAGNMTMPAQNIFIRCEAIEPDRTACMKFAGADADLRTETVAETVRKSCGHVVEDARCIDLAQEAIGSRGVFGKNALGMRRAVRDGDRKLAVLGVPVLNGAQLPKAGLEQQFARSLAAVQ